MRRKDLEKVQKDIAFLLVMRNMGERAKNTGCSGGHVEA